MPIILIIAIIFLFLLKPRTTIRIIGALVVAILALGAWGNVWIMLFALVVTAVPSNWVNGG